MSERTAKRLVKLAPAVFLLAMIVPPGPMKSFHQGFGFQLAMLSLYGAMMGSPLSIIGAIANLAFLLASLFLLIRLARRRPWPGFRLIFYLALLSCLAMMVARAWLPIPTVTPIVSPGF